MTDKEQQPTTRTVESMHKVAHLVVVILADKVNFGIGIFAGVVEGRSEKRCLHRG